MGQSQPKLGNTIPNILIKTIDSIMGWAYPEGGVAVKAKTGKINNKIFISYCQKVVMSSVSLSSSTTAAQIDDIILFQFLIKYLYKIQMYVLQHITCP